MYTLLTYLGEDVPRHPEGLLRRPCRPEGRAEAPVKRGARTAAHGALSKRSGVPTRPHRCTDRSSSPAAGLTTRMSFRVQCEEGGPKGPRQCTGVRRRLAQMSSVSFHPGRMSSAGFSEMRRVDAFVDFCIVAAYGDVASSTSRK